uniref:Uncharacterized protein n=1 Tax=viral metagenome TaxID=1070528 RepID=A0A6C0IYT4_9ZZZZ
MGCSFGLLVGLEILGLNSVGQVESCHRLTEVNLQLASPSTQS